jgi:outer membrane protein W
MKCICIRIAFVFACVTAVPSFAADRAFDLTGWAAWIDPNGSHTSFRSPAAVQLFDVDYTGKLGYGIGANIFFGSHVSAAFDAVRARPKTTVVSPPSGVSYATGGTRMTPLSGVLQWHFAPDGVVDPYVGAGVAYVLFDKADVFGNGVLGQIDVKDKAGLALNAGVSLLISRRLAFTADGKYVPLKASANAVYPPGTIPLVPVVLNVKINPVIFSGGLSLRF